MIPSFLRFAVLSFLVGSVAACGAAEDAVSSTTDALKVDGSWNGTWENSRGTGGVTRVSLSQDGWSVTGTVEFVDNPCFPTATLHGWVDTDGLHAELESGEAHIAWEAGIHGQDLSGEWSSLGAAECAADKGLLKLSR